MESNTIKEKILHWFVAWSKMKPSIHFGGKNAFPKKREIWWASLGQNIGVETNGKHGAFERPVLVIKVFNAESSLVAPVSSRVNTDQYLFKFTNASGEDNAINLSQMRTISSKRFRRNVGELSVSDFAKVQKMIRDFL